VGSISKTVCIYRCLLIGNQRDAGGGGWVEQRTSGEWSTVWELQCKGAGWLWLPDSITEPAADAAGYELLPVASLRIPRCDLCNSSFATRAAAAVDPATNLRMSQSAPRYTWNRLRSADPGLCAFTQQIGLRTYVAPAQVSIRYDTLTVFAQ